MKKNKAQVATFFFMVIFSYRANATPLKIQMIFLSPQKIAQVINLIDKNKLEMSFSLLADSSTEDGKCVPMGEGCFHPQHGYMDKKPSDSAMIKVAPVAAPSDPELKLKTFNAIETNMINCEKGNYFDIFCGKEKPKAAAAEVEIWFDISSSLRTVDFSKDGNFCDRRSFMSKVMDGCKSNVRVSVYNTSLKEVGDHSGTCLAYGTNDESRLLKWIKESSAKTLLIVTDVDEVSGEMRDFLDERGAKILGDGVKPFTSTDLINYANDFIKTCKK